MLPLDPIIQSVIRPDIQAMRAYHVPSSAGMVKLDAMENPFRLSESLQQKLGQRLGRVALNRYPGECVGQLHAALSDHVQMPATHQLMLGNGSDELISLLALACARPGATILAPVPGFVMYEMSAQLQSLAFVGVPTTAEFEIDEAAMLAAIAQHRPAITYLAYPNNPTANLFNDLTLERIVVAVGEQGGLAVFDEAYQPFASRSWMSRAAAYPHVLVMRTLSKLGLAGVRLGYMVGATSLIDHINKVRPPYNVSALNAEAALFALEHFEEFANQAAVLRNERERLQHLLSELPGVRSFPSEANMILFRVPDAQRCFDGMKQRGVLIRNISAFHPLLAQCLRLTVGTPEENNLMFNALKASLL